MAMRRREFLRTGAVVGVTTAMAGCTAGTGSDESPQTETSPPAAESDGETPQDTETPVRYFFEDETGALGHLGDENTPGDYDHVITNTATEADYDEIQRNDRVYPEGLEQGQLTMSVDEMITRAEELYRNPQEKIDTLGIEDLNFAEEDDEIVFTRALIQASKEAGVDSSGLANIVVSNMAEDAVDQIQPGFTNFKLSTLAATEPVAPGGQGHSGGVRENEFNQSFGNSGFRHMAALLQYEKDGETQLKYAEQTDPVNVDIFRRVIRDPQFSLYRSSLDQDTVDTSRDSKPGDTGSAFPEHYVTAFDYTKARELERADENILGYIQNESGTVVGLGDQIDEALRHLVDDMGVTGYNNNEDLNLGTARPDWGGTVVSDQFGESLEEYVLGPTTENRQYLENIGRGLFQIRNQEGMDTSIALTGTVEDPEILPTDQSTLNAVREDQVYDQVRERVLQ